MKWKKIAAGVLCVGVVAVLAGCGGHEGSANSMADSGSSSVVENTYSCTDETEKNDDYSPIVKPENKPDEVSELSVECLEFQNFSYEWENPDGYRLQISYGISPWIKWDNKTLLETTWKRISPNSEVPYSSTFVVGDSITSGATVNDLAYAIGFVGVKNLTPNFDITDSTPLDVDIMLGTDPWAIKLHNGNYFQGYSRLTVAWSSKNTEYGLVSEIYGNMKTGLPSMSLRRNDGTVAFIIALPIINVSPNLPLGEPNPAEVRVRVFEPGEINPPKEIHLFDSIVTW